METGTVSSSSLSLASYNAEIVTYGVTRFVAMSEMPVPPA
jgi:hypothetical protein